MIMRILGGGESKGGEGKGNGGKENEKRGKVGVYI